jgi:adenine phosphoribosyltransferase
MDAPGNTYKLTVAGVTRHLPRVRVSPSLSIASFVMLGDTELIEKCADALYNHRDFPKYEVDVLVCPEAKAIPLAHALARLCQVNYIVVRKSVKSYMQDPLTEQAQSITTAGTQMLVLNGPDVQKLRGRQVCIVDDVVSTGGSITALERLLTKAGCRVIGKVAVLLEEGGYDKGDLVYLERLPVFRD